MLRRHVNKLDLIYLGYEGLQYGGRRPAVVNRCLPRLRTNIIDKILTLSNNYIFHAFLYFTVYFLFIYIM